MFHHHSRKGSVIVATQLGIYSNLTDNTILESEVTTLLNDNLDTFQTTLNSAIDNLQIVQNFNNNVGTTGLYQSLYR